MTDRASTISGRGIYPMSRIVAFALLLPVVIALAGCGTAGKPSSSSTLPKGGGAYKVGNPYQIAGIWYYPYEDEKYDSTGIASWYGPQFHGKKTANGEVFDQNEMSAAHPTLPMPVLARVTNLENGKSIVVRINDRGPFAAGREIDMSKRAAEELGFMQKGTAKVRVQYIGRAPLQGGLGDGRGVAETFIAPKVDTPAEERQVAAAAPVKTVSAVSSTALAAPVGAVSAPPQSLSPSLPTPAAEPAMQPIRDDPGTARQVPVTGTGNIYVQAGSFQNLQNAERVRQQLAGLGPVEIQTTTVDGTAFYRVRVGPMSDVPAADTSLQNIVQRGHSGARIVVD